MANAISGFDRWVALVGALAGARDRNAALDRVASLAGSELGIRMRFSEIQGRRWSFIAGDRQETPGDEPMTRVDLDGKVGLVMADLAGLDHQFATRVVSFLRQFVRAQRDRAGPGDQDEKE